MREIYLPYTTTSYFYIILYTFIYLWISNIISIIGLQQCSLVRQSTTTSTVERYSNYSQCLAKFTLSRGGRTLLNMVKGNPTKECHAVQRFIQCLYRTYVSKSFQNFFVLPQLFLEHRNISVSLSMQFIIFFERICPVLDIYSSDSIFFAFIKVLNPTNS